LANLPEGFQTAIRESITKVKEYDGINIPEVVE
jgi:hypothetical protein